MKVIYAWLYLCSTLLIFCSVSSVEAHDEIGFPAEWLVNYERATNVYSTVWNKSSHDNDLMEMVFDSTIKGEQVDIGRPTAKASSYIQNGDIILNFANFSSPKKHTLFINIRGEKKLQLSAFRAYVKAKLRGKIGFIR